MPGLSERLRAAREKKGLTLAEVEVEIRIRAKIIEALEAGDNQQLPPAPFDRGLLKNYALFLDLDPDVILDEYAIEVGLKPAANPQPEAPTLTLQPATPLEFEAAPNVISPTETSGTQPPNQTKPYPWRQALVPPGPRPLNRGGKAESEEVASAHPETKPVPTFDRSSGTRHAERIFATSPETVFEIAPEISLEPAPAPDRLVWTQRIGATKLPEAIAAIAVAVAILGLAVFGYNRLFSSENRAPQSASAELPPAGTATPQQTTIPLPTSVPTFEATLSGGNEITPGPTKAKPKGGTAVPINPASGQMQVQITAGTSPVWVWVIADNVEAFKGNLQNETKTWNAHERLYIQVKDLPNGSVSFNGKAILARVFAERKVIERAWQTSPTGAAVAVEPKAIVPTATLHATLRAAATPTEPIETNPTPSPAPPPTSSDTPTAGESSLPKSASLAGSAGGLSVREPEPAC